MPEDQPPFVPRRRYDPGHALSPLEFRAYDHRYQLLHEMQRRHLAGQARRGRRLGHEWPWTAIVSALRSTVASALGILVGWLATPPPGTRVR
jgi:hypothetical protein